MVTVLVEEPEGQMLLADEESVLNIISTSELQFRVMGSNRVMVTITPEGRVVIGDGVNLDEAAKAFWDAVRGMASVGGVRQVRHAPDCPEPSVLCAKCGGTP